MEKGWGQCFLFTSVLWHCRLGDRKDVRLMENLWASGERKSQGNRLTQVHLEKAVKMEVSLIIDEHLCVPQWPICIGAVFSPDGTGCCRKLGQTSRTAKCQLFESFREAATRLGRTDLLQRCSMYRAAKDAAEQFRAAKQLLCHKFRASGYGTWVTKPPEEEMFTFSAASPAGRKSLIPPGSFGVPSRGLQPSQTYTDDDASEDFS